MVHPMWCIQCGGYRTCDTSFSWLRWRHEKRKKCSAHHQSGYKQVRLVSYEPKRDVSSVIREFLQLKFPLTFSLKIGYVSFLRNFLEISFHQFHFSSLRGVENLRHPPAYFLARLAWFFQTKMHALLAHRQDSNSRNPDGLFGRTHLF